MKKLIPRRLAPKFAKTFVRNYRKRKKRALVNSRKPLRLSELRNVVKDDLGLRRGNTAFIHSAFGSLNLECSPEDLLDLLLNIVGPSGNLLFPYYPGTAHEALEKGNPFDPRTTRSATGILTDLARRHNDSIISRHPVKAVAAIGPLAKELTAGHESSPFPYDQNSPYCRVMETDGLLIGLGVWTYNLSFVHTVDDTMRESFPVCPYLPKLFKGYYRLANDDVIDISSFAHDVDQVGHDTRRVPYYMKRYIKPDICADVEINGRRYFRGKGRALYSEMTNVAKNGHTLFMETEKITTPEIEKRKWENLLTLY